MATTPIGGPRERDLWNHDDEGTSPVAGPPPAIRDFEPDGGASYDALALAFVRNASAPPPTGDDRILYLGFNSASAAPELRGLGPAATALAHAPAGEADCITVGARTFDLSVPSEAIRWANTLGLEPREADAVASAIAASAPGSRDVLARIAMSWADGIKAGSVPSRLVLSGHSDGDALWGDRGDHVALHDLFALARAMPKAAACIQDLHLAACNSAKNGTAEEERKLLLEAFPNLKTFWGYQGASPMAPVDHLAAWQRATVGDATKIELTPALRNANATTVDATGKASGAMIDMPKAEFLAKLEKQEALYIDKFVTKHWALTSDPGNYLYPIYQYFQAAVARDDLGIDKDKYRALAAHALRLRFYDETIRSTFQATYGAVITAAYAELGRRPVDFAKLSREAAEAELKAVLLAIDHAKPSPVLAKAIVPLRGLLTLDPDAIPADWCAHR
jgi:hypothetical protein